MNHIKTIMALTTDYDYDVSEEEKTAVEKLIGLDRFDLIVEKTSLPEQIIKNIFDITLNKWLDTNFPQFKDVVATFGILNDALVSGPQKQQKLDAFLDTYEMAFKPSHLPVDKPLSHLMKDGSKVYIEATLVKQWGFGQYETEPAQGFVIKIGKYEHDVVLDDVKVLI